jgi:pyruvate/2-oxoglutarate/acetoin dehydrogenase E1 component
VTIRIRSRILNARLAAEAVSGGGVDQAYDGWRVVSEFEFQQWVETGYSPLISARCTRLILLRQLRGAVILAFCTSACRRLDTLRI